MKLAFIISLPRSGSTVLSAMLDRYKGVVSPPESSFPQVLSAITPEERADKKMMASLYFGATYTPTPLSFEEAEACMVGTDEDILISIGKAVAEKLGRNTDEINAVVWKSPKTIAMQLSPLYTSGKFIVLRRNPHNVFESQFRIDFGKKNRNPYRFALLRESYEKAFSDLPKDRIINISYDDLPDALAEILNFIGIPDEGFWSNYQSSLQKASDSIYYMAEVTKEFENRDIEKRSRLNKLHVKRLQFAMALTRPLRAFLGPIRNYYDFQSMEFIRKLAREHYARIK